MLPVNLSFYLCTLNQYECANTAIILSLNRHLCKAPHPHTVCGLADSMLHVHVKICKMAAYTTKQNLREEDNLSTRDKWSIPKVSSVWRFYCILRKDFFRVFFSTTFLSSSERLVTQALSVKGVACEIRKWLESQNQCCTVLEVCRYCRLQFCLNITHIPWIFVIQETTCA